MKKFLALIIALLAVLSCSTKMEQPTVSVQSISLSTTSFNLVPGEKALLFATVNPQTSTRRTITWATTNKSVVTVSNNGEVQAIDVGTCTISASCEGKKAECLVTVAYGTIPVTGINLDKRSETIVVGKSLQLTASVYPENATDKTVTWISSKSDVTKVENGLVIGLTAGQTTITASAGNKTATCEITVNEPYTYGGMCLESIGNGFIIVQNPNKFTIEYKIEEDEWTSSDAIVFNVVPKNGERVWFRGHNATYAFGNSTDGFSGTRFECRGGDFYLYGNMMSLIYGDDYSGKTELTEDNTFYLLFYQNGNILNHPAKDIELPATTITQFCYRTMFGECAKLTRAPKLPAKVLKRQCYASMFSDCPLIKEFPEMGATEMDELSCWIMMKNTGIEEIPALPAMNLAEGCYYAMFAQCHNLKKAPAILPATALANKCYYGMFHACEQLTEAPELPATELKPQCYLGMFKDCTSLKNAPQLPAMNMAALCYSIMFKGTNITVAPELPATTLAARCYEGMFGDCKELEKAPVLPALQLETFCYDEMFKGCSKLNYIKALFLTKPSNEYADHWVEGVAAEGAFVKNPDATWNVRGVNGVPAGWTIEY